MNIVKKKLKLGKIEKQWTYIACKILFYKGLQVFLLTLVFPKFRPFFLKVGKIYENLGKSWESEKRWEEEISGNYFWVYFQYKQKYILKIILIFMVYKTKSLLYGSKNL